MAHMVNKSACNAGDPGSIPGLEDPLEKGMETHVSILAWKISMHRGAWWAAVRRVTKSQTTERLTHLFLKYLIDFAREAIWV